GSGWAGQVRRWVAIASPTRSGSGTERYDDWVLRGADSTPGASDADQLPIDPHGTAKELDAVHRDAQQLAGPKTEAGPGEDQSPIPIRNGVGEHETSSVLSTSSIASERLVGRRTSIQGVVATIRSRTAARNTAT